MLLKVKQSATVLTLNVLCSIMSQDQNALLVDLVTAHNLYESGCIEAEQYDTACEKLLGRLVSSSGASLSDKQAALAAAAADQYKVMPAILQTAGKQLLQLITGGAGPDAGVSGISQGVHGLAVRDIETSLAGRNVYLMLLLCKPCLHACIQDVCWYRRHNVQPGAAARSGHAAAASSTTATSAAASPATSFEVVAAATAVARAFAGAAAAAAADAGRQAS